VAYNLGSARGNIHITYDSRGVARARDDLGRFVSASQNTADSTDRDAKRISKAFNGVSLGIRKMLKVFALVGGAANVLVNSIGLIAGATQAIIPVINASLATLPGILLSAAAAAVVLRVAMAGVGDAMKAAFEQDPEKLAEAMEKLAPSAKQFAQATFDAVKQLRPLQQLLQDEVFTGTGPAVTQLAAAFTTLGPQAQGVARAFGAIFRELLQLAGSPVFIDALSKSLSGVRDFLNGIRQGLAPLITGFADLAGQASQFADEAGGAIGGLLRQFGNFLRTLDLKSMWEEAIPIIKSFATLIASVGSILASLFTGLGLAGGDAIGVLGQLTTTLANFLKTAEAQQALQALGSALQAISGAFGQAFLALLSNLAPILVRLAPLIGQLATAIGDILATAFDTLGPPILTIAGALVDALLPVMPQLMAAFQSIAPVIGRLAQMLGDHLGRILPLIVPLFVELATVLADVLVQALEALLPSMEQLLPVFAEFGREILPSLLPLIRTFGELLIAVAPALGTIAAIIAGTLIAVMPLLADAVQAVAATLNFLVSVIATVIGWWNRLVSSFVTLERVKAIVSSIVTTIASLWQWLFNLLLGGSIIPDIVNGIIGWFNKLVGLLRGILNTITGVFRSGVQAWLAAFELLGSLPGRVAAWFGQISSAIRGALNTALGVVRSFPGQVLGALGGLGGLLFGAGVSLIQGLINGIRSMAGTVMSAVRNLVSGIPGMIKDALRIGSPSKITIELGAEVSAGLAVGILKNIRDIERAVMQAARAVQATLPTDFSASVQAAVGTQTSAPTTSAGTAAVAAGSGAALTVNQNVYALPGMDAQQVGDYTLRRLSFGVLTGTSSVVEAVGGVA
jgi:phage-related protein